MAQPARLEVALRLGPVDLAFASEGGTIGLFGPSGSGKTTAVESIAGLRRPAAGRIAHAGRVLFDAAAGVDLPPRERRVGFVPQEGLLFPHLDVRANLAFGRPEGATGPGVEEVARALEIENLLDRRPAGLSGGERQRVALGRALVRAPDLLLLDEPLASLDEPLRLRLLEALVRVKRLGGPMVYVSHRASEVRALADDVVVLRAGRVVRQGPPADVLAPDADAAADGDGEPDAHVIGTVAGREGEVARVRAAAGGVEIEVVAAAPVGAPVRLEVPAAAVTIVAPGPEPGRASARNRLAARVVSLGRHGDAVLVALEAGTGGLRLYATVTQRSARDLGLVPGAEIVAAVKATAVRVVG